MADVMTGFMQRRAVARIGENAATMADLGNQLGAAFSDLVPCLLDPLRGPVPQEVLDSLDRSAKNLHQTADDASRLEAIILDESGPLSDRLPQLLALRDEITSRMKA